MLANVKFRKAGRDRPRQNDFPAWIGVNELSDSYVVGLNFTRGHLHTPSVCKWKGGKLIEM